MYYYSGGFYLLYVKYIRNTNVLFSFFFWHIKYILWKLTTPITISLHFTRSWTASFLNSCIPVLSIKSFFHNVRPDGFLGRPWGLSSISFLLFRTLLYLSSSFFFASHAQPSEIHCPLVKLIDTIYSRSTFPPSACSFRVIVNRP